MLVLAVTRGVDRSAAGVVFTVTSAFLLLESLVRLGTDVGVVHFVAMARARNDRRGVSSALVASIVPVGFAGVFGAAATVLLARGVIHSLGRLPPGVHVRAMADIAAVLVPIAALHDVMTAATRGLGTSRPTVLLERLLRPALQLVGIVLSLVLHAGPLGLVTAWLAPYAAVMPLTAAWLLRLLRTQDIPLSTDGWREAFVPVWRFTLPRSFATVAQILLQRLDIVLVGAFLGGAAAAVYTGATRFVVVGQLGNQAMTFAFQPQLARLIGRGEVEQARLLYRVSTVWIVGLTAPLYLAVCLSSPLLVRLLGAHYGSGIKAMILVTGAMLVANACGMVDIVLVTMGRTTWNLANTTIALVLDVGLDLILIPTVGITGAAIGWAVAILATNLIPLVQIRRSFGFSPVTPAYVRLLAVIGGGFGVLPGLLLIVIGAHVLPTALLLAGVLVIYVCVVWRWRQSLHVDTLLRVRRA